MDAVYGPEALQYAINYYQGALIHILPNSRGAIHLALAKCYHELCYHEWKREMAESSLEHFESALKCFLDTKQRIESINGKTYLLIELVMDNEDENAKETLAQWIESVIESSKCPETLAVYGLLSHCWPIGDSGSKWGDLFQLNSSIVWFSRSSYWNSPCIIHLLTILKIAIQMEEESPIGNSLRDLIDCLTHLEIFFERADWRVFTLYASLALKQKEHETILETWKKVYLLLFNRFRELLCEHPPFLNADAVCVDRDIAKIEALLERNSRKPTPRCKLAE
jgi:tetratricopeptide (TPR) repeat protein